MVITTKEMYSEVYGILKALGDKYINKLPKTVLKVITESKEENYNPEYSMSIPLKEQDINRKSGRFPGRGINVLVLVELDVGELAATAPVPGHGRMHGVLQHARRGRVGRIQVVQLEGHAQRHFHTDVAACRHRAFDGGIGGS